MKKLLIALLISWSPIAMGQALPEKGVDRQDDYLPSELRVQVERLKKDVADVPSTAENGRVRAKALWKWANAFALNGGVLPVDLASTITRLSSPAPPRRGTLAALDAFVRELKLHDENPSALGKLTTDSKGPFLPGSFVTIEQTYHFADRPMTPGGGFFVAKHFMSNQGRYQTDQPGDENYITIRSSNPKARFAAGSRSWSVYGWQV